MFKRIAVFLFVAAVVVAATNENEAEIVKRSPAPPGPPGPPRAERSPAPPGPPGPPRAERSPAPPGPPGPPRAERSPEPEPRKFAGVIRPHVIRSFGRFGVSKLLRKRSPEPEPKRGKKKQRKGRSPVPEPPGPPRNERSPAPEPRGPPFRIERSPEPKFKFAVSRLSPKLFGRIGVVKSVGKRSPEPEPKRGKKKQRKGRSPEPEPRGPPRVERSPQPPGPPRVERSPFLKPRVLGRLRLAVLRPHVLKRSPEPEPKKLFSGFRKNILGRARPAVLF